MSKPNLFNFATNELSQDAFLCWLLSWANGRNYSDFPRLTECARSFINRLIQKKDKNACVDVQTIEVCKQWNHVDVNAIVNKKYFIAIEDKINAQEDGNQLERYKKTAEDYCGSTIKDFEIHLIYLKTGSESSHSLKGVEQKGYSVFKRSDLLNLLHEFKDIRNDIFVDFCEKLDEIEKEELAFANKSIKDWGWANWTGFYLALENILGREVNWFYVNNPSNPFLGAVVSGWFCWDIIPTYIQIEQGALCFKLSTSKEETGNDNLDASSIRNDFCWSFLKYAHEKSFSEIRKPQRLGKGNYMTFAVVDKANWLGKDDAIVSLDDVAAKINKYCSFLEEFINSKTDVKT